MEIIRRGTNTKDIECDCGCIFRYTDEDTHWFKCSTGGEVVFVICPDCGKPHIIKQPEGFKGKITKVDEQQKMLAELREIMVRSVENGSPIDDFTYIIPMAIYEASRI